MKNISFKTIVAIITFVVGVTFVIFCFKLLNQTSVESNISKVSQESEDYEIYSVALKKLFIDYSGELLIISNTTSDKSSTKLKPEFKIPIKYVFIDEEKYSDEILADETDSKQKSNKPNILEFFKEHPKALGIVRLSSVEYNEDKTKADVYVELTNCPLCGFGTNVSLEKSEGSWKIKNASSSRVS